MTTKTNIRNTLTAAILGMTIMAPQQASAGLLNNVYNKANAAYIKASQTLSKVNVVQTVVNRVDGKIDKIQANIAQIPAKLDALPDPAFVLGNARSFIEDNVIRVTDELDRVRTEFQLFKGDNCSAGTDCAALRARLLGIYNGLNGIRDTLPGYDILPAPGSLFADPKEMAIKNLPPLVLFGLNTLTGRLDGLDRVEDMAQWIDGLRLYKIKPVEEDESYRLPQSECSTLEASIKTENAQFTEMKDIIEKTGKVTYFMKEIMPKTIVINAWVGTSLPNPALPVSVFMNKMAKDFKELLELELDARKDQVKQCRQQAFKNDVQAKLDSLLGR